MSPATGHRRFTAWTKAGLWRRLRRVVLGELGARGLGYRRRTVRYQREGSHFLAFLGLATALTC